KPTAPEQLPPKGAKYSGEDAPAAFREGGGEDGPAPTAPCMTWREAAERLERLRAQSEPWTSNHKLAEQLGCSPATILKATRSTPVLKAWAKRAGAAPGAQSINDVVMDRLAQSSEPDPEDAAAIKEHLDRDDLTDDERAWFLALSLPGQIAFLSDPDKHQK